MAEVLEVALDFIDASEPPQRIQPDGIRAAMRELFEVAAHMRLAGNADAAGVMLWVHRRVVSTVAISEQRSAPPSRRACRPRSGMQPGTAPRDLG